MTEQYMMRLKMRTCEAQGMRQTDARSDDELLLAIGRDRDETAFAHLFQRHHLHAFNLAFYMTCDKQLAQDAVQEAMLGIWFNAKAYRPGNPRGWILNIVSKKSFNITRGKQRRKTFVARLKAHASSPTKGQASSVQESTEQADIVRDAIGALEISDRQLVALHYGAGLSQHQIARELSIPQRTVSDRIRRLLDKLRKELQGKGFSALTPTVLVELITNAVCTGLPTPSMVNENILEHLSRTQTSDHLAGAKEIQPSHVRVVLVSSMLLLAIAGTWVAFTPVAHQSSGIMESKAEHDGQVEAVIGEDVPKPVEFNYEDDFDGRELNVFWANPKKSDHVNSGKGLKNSELFLNVDARDSSLQHAQITELYSRDIDLHYQYFAFELVSGRPTGKGVLEYGFEVLGENGKALFSQAFEAKSLPKKGYVIKRLIGIDGKDTHITNPLIHVKNLHINSFKVKANPIDEALAREFADDKKVSYTYAKTDETKFKAFGDAKVIRIRMYVKAEPGSWMRWPIKKFTFKLIPRTSPDASQE